MPFPLLLASYATAATLGSLGRCSGRTPLPVRLSPNRNARPSIYLNLTVPNQVRTIPSRANSSFSSSS
jgi:hypothetical protein